VPENVRCSFAGFFDVTSPQNYFLFSSTGPSFPIVPGIVWAVWGTTYGMRLAAVPLTAFRALLWTWIFSFSTELVHIHALLLFFRLVLFPVLFSARMEPSVISLL